MAREFYPHQCEHCDTLLAASDGHKCEIQVPTEHVFSAASQGCAFFQWCSNWKSYAPEAESRDTSAFRVFDALLLEFDGWGHDGIWDIQALFVSWLKYGAVSSSQNSRKYEQWPKSVNRKKELMVYAEPGDPSATFISSRPPNPSPGSMEALEQAYVWRMKCIEEHEQCPSAFTYAPSPETNPGRLLEFLVGVHPIRLIKTRGQDKYPYAALSYCWGGPQTLKLTRATLTALEENISYDALPQTLKDAVRVTNWMGLCYIWIDSLCIIQDDPEDLVEEMKKMKNIYTHAELTIVAERASRVVRASYTNAHYPTYGRILVSEYDALADAPKQPLNQRAWTLQERMLSPRVLSFGTRFTRWTCCSAKLADGGLNVPLEIGSPYEIDVDAKMTWSAFPPEATATTRLLHLAMNLNSQMWQWRIEEYSGRELSCPADKLPAIAGMAEVLWDIWHGQKKSNYVAGLWKNDIIWSLLWVRPGFTFHNGPFPRPQYRAPTWSWASIEGRVAWRGPKNLFWKVPRVEVVEAQTDLVSESLPFGAVKYGWLRVRGPMKKARWLQQLDNLEQYGLLSERDEIIRIIPEIDVSDTNFHRYPFVWCLLIGLMVRGVGDRRTSDPVGLLLIETIEGFFERIGYFGRDMDTLRELEAFVRNEAQAQGQSSFGNSESSSESSPEVAPGKGIQVIEFEEWFCGAADRDVDIL